MGPMIKGAAIGVVATLLAGIAVWLTVAYTGAYNVAATDMHAAQRLADGLHLEIERETSVEEVNALFRTAAEGPRKGIVGYEERPLVSADYVNDPQS